MDIQEHLRRSKAIYSQLNKSSIADMAYANEQDTEWLRSIEIDGLTQEILHDASGLDLAVGDQVYGAEPFDPQSFLTARANIAKAKDDAELLEAAKLFRNELELVARKQAEVMVDQQSKVSMFHRRQAE